MYHLVHATVHSHNRAVSEQTAVHEVPVCSTDILYSRYGGNNRTNECILRLSLQLGYNHVGIK